MKRQTSINASDGTTTTMRTLSTRPLRRLGAAAALGGLAVGSLALPQAPLTSRAQAAGTTRTVGPGVDLRAALNSLHPGDTLALRPGTYHTGLVSPAPASTAVGADRKMSVGTAAARITVRAADPRNRPVILGEIKLWGPSYWILDGLKVQAVDATRDALYIGGGTGWVVRNSEFSGANNTGAYSNVTIGTDVYGTGAPRAFAFTGNCVHDAAHTNRSFTDHNIYVSYAGNSSSGGEISRNIIFNHPNGAGIKLGNGGVPGARGPWGVQVAYNTVAQGGRQVLLHGDVRGNTISRNILSTSTKRLGTSKLTTSVYLNLVVGGGNTFANNYAASSSVFSFGKTARIGVDNAVRADPGFAGSGCGGFVPDNAKATAYGRYGAGALPTW